MMTNRFIVYLQKFGATATLAVLLTSGAAAEERKFCGKLASPHGAYSASLVLVHPSVTAKPKVNVFLCDTSYNCDVVFVSAADPTLGIIWRGNSKLVIAAKSGLIVRPGQIASIGSGRPMVKIVRSTSSKGARLHSGWHSFVGRNCVAQPPVVQTVTKGKK